MNAMDTDSTPTDADPVAKHKLRLAQLDEWFDRVDPFGDHTPQDVWTEKQKQNAAARQQR